MVHFYYTNAGKLPIDINKSWSPNDVLSEPETELPPPLPPRSAGL